MAVVPARLVVDASAASCWRPGRAALYMMAGAAVAHVLSLLPVCSTATSHGHFDCRGAYTSPVARGVGAQGSMPARQRDAHHAAGAAPARVPYAQSYRTPPDDAILLPLPAGVAAGTPLHAALSAARRVLLTSAVDMKRYTPNFCARQFKAFQAATGGVPLEPGAYQPPPGAPRLVVVGRGGSGVTFSIGMLHNALWPYGWSANKANCGTDKGTNVKEPVAALWKHRTATPSDTDLLACYGATRIVYVFNDPALAIASLVRRSLNPTRNDTILTRAQSAMDRLGGHNVATSKLQAWLAVQPPCPVLYVDFASLARNHQLVADFLGVPVKAMAPFVLRPRLTADPRASLPAEFVDLHGAMYTQMMAVDLTIRLPSNYVDVPALAAGPLAPVRDPLPPEELQPTDIGVGGALRRDAPGGVAHRA
jgi:hypothetical protein